MKRLSTFAFSLILFLATAGSSCETLGTLAGTQQQPGLTNTEVVSGLKQALEVGIGNATNITGQVDGYLKNELIRIAFPPEAQKVQETVLKYGGSLGQQVVDDLITKMNRAAEAAASNPETKQIFVDAIRGMTIGDGFNILRGDSTAATGYLRERTFQPLQDLYAPIVRNKMEEAGVQQAWQAVASAYNKVKYLTRDKQEVPEDISGYVTGRALDGLFTVVGQEEAKIRRDPIARTTDLLKKVFGSQGR